MTRTSIRRVLPVAALATLLTLTACGGPAEEEPSDAAESTSDAPTPEETAPPSTDTSSEPAPEPTETTEPAPEAATLEVTVTGGEITPNAAEIDLAVGEPLAITIDADRPGEFHVHSKPEQYLNFDSGVTTQELVVETPGTVEVEEHDSGSVVALLEVS